MRLLLDEILSAVIAERLRERGLDVIAVQELRELRGLADGELFEFARRDERAILTYNCDDFLALDRQWRAAGRHHHGLVLLHPRRFPQAIGAIGALVEATDASLKAGPPYPSFVHWLQ